VSARRPAPAQCANCGTAIPPRSLSCPECGADEQTGWREQSLYDGLDLPDDADAFEKPPARGLSLGWKTIGVVLIVLVVLLAFRSL